MSRFEPVVNFAELSDIDIAEMALDAAQVSFEHDLMTGTPNGDSLVNVIGYIAEDGAWHQLATRNFGKDAAEFLPYIDPEFGKLATVLRLRVDSIAGYFMYDEDIPMGPQRFTGGVYHIARAKTMQHGWMYRAFAGASSGVQGHLDMATMYVALPHAGAYWALKQIALFGKAD